MAWAPDDGGLWYYTPTPGQNQVGQPGQPPIPNNPGAPGGGGAGGGSGPAGTITLPSTTPDYAALIKNDPAYMAWQTSRQQREANAATQRAAAIRALILKYGGLPPGFTDAFGDVTPEDLANAQANPYSDQQQIEKMYQQGVASMKRALAARGGLQSGELGYGQEQQDYGHGLALNNEVSSIMSAIQAALGGYSTTIGDVESELPGVINAAEGNVRQEYQPTGGGSATLVPNSSSQYGFPVYQDANGGYWRVNPATGQPESFTPPAVVPPPPVPPPGPGSSSGYYNPAVQQGTQGGRYPGD